MLERMNSTPKPATKASEPIAHTSLTNRAAVPANPVTDG
jgi:hypothetical protein